MGVGAVAAVVSAVASTAAAVDQYKSGKRAEDRAEKQAAQQEAAIAAETKEMVRREEKVSERQRGAALARAAASGGKVRGTVASYLREMEDENLRNVNWIKRSGSTRAQTTGESIRDRGQTASEMARYGALGTIGSTTSNLYSAGQGQGWWK